MQLRPIGASGIEVSPVALGCWPIAGMTSLDVNEQDSLRTLEAALDSGVNFFDTAYCYGAHGESERLIQKVIQHRRDDVVIATKGGVHWAADRQRVQDATPDRLKQECDESLARLQTDRVELLYLHAPDPNVPIADSAGALLELKQAGKARAIGASNLSVSQLQEFHAICPLNAVQPPYNMLQRQIEDELLPWCRERSVPVMVYWPLMKGLLAGHMQRDFQFKPGDGRAKYPMYSGDEWHKNQDFVMELRTIAESIEKTVAQVVINWTINQPGVTVALCGAKRAQQIQETAGAMGWKLEEHQFRRIEIALKRRGSAVVGRAI